MRRNLLLALAAVAALAGCAADGSCKLEALTQSPLAAAGGHLFTRMGVNGRSALMMIDSGAFSSLLTADAVERYGVRTTVSAASLQRSLGGVGGSRDLSIVQPDQISLGRLSGKALRLASADWTPPLSRPPIDGLLGADLLGAYDVDYDLLGGKLTLYKAKGRSASTPVALTGDLFRAEMLPAPAHDQRAFVTVTVDGRDVRALVDTGADGSVLFRGAASRLGLDYDALAAHGTRARASGIGPDKVDAVRQVLPLVAMGDLTIRNLPVSVLDEGNQDAGMLLGQDFLRKVHVWVSNSDRALIFQLPPLPSPPVDLAAAP